MTKTRKIPRPLGAAAAAFILALALAPGAAGADGDAAAGKKVFKKCRICHATVAGRKMVGPSLFAVVGRKAGQEAYKYSKAMKAKAASGLVWSEDNLDKWLAKPKAFVPKTKMAFPGLKKAKQRADVIAYLKTLK